MKSFRLLWLLVALLPWLIAPASTLRGGAPSTGSVGANPNEWGLIGGTIATDETMEALMNLDHLRGLQNLPRFYFSSGASSTGTATSGGNNILTHTSNFTADLLTGQTVRITAGTGIAQTRKIVGNTVSILTVSPVWNINPDSTSVYDVYTGEWPTGIDTNPCTQAAPCLTFVKMKALFTEGNVHLILDAGDTWAGTADWGSATPAGITYTGSCADGTACVVMSGSDFTGKTRPTLDCTGIKWTGSGLLGSSQSAPTDGWVVYQNLQTDRCPNKPWDAQDIFRNNTAGSMLVLNAKVPYVIGKSNQAFTSHSTGPSIVLNLDAYCGDNRDFDGECTDTDDPYSCCDATSECMDEQPDLYAPAAGGPSANILITPYELYGTSGTSAANQVLRLSSSGETFIYGPIVSWKGSNSATNRALTSAIGAGGTHNIAVARTVFKEFDSATAAGVAVNLLPTAAGATVNFNGFRNTYLHNHYAIRTNPSGVGSTSDITNRCSLFDEATDASSSGDRYILKVDVDANTTVDMQFNIHDDDDGAGDPDSYLIDTTPYKDAAAAVAGLGSVFTALMTNSTISGGDGSDGNQFGSLEHAAICDSGEACHQACSVSWSYTLPVAIPKFVLGTNKEIVSVFLNGSLDGNIGAK